MSKADDLRIRAMAPEEIAVAADWAAAEGWNPGLGDAVCFATVDAGGFLIGELDGAPAATISCVNYDDRFAFLGFYIVRPDLRGRGYGLRIWNAAVEHVGGHRMTGIAEQDDAALAPGRKRITLEDAPLVDLRRRVQHRPDVGMEIRKRRAHLREVAFRGPGFLGGPIRLLGLAGGEIDLVAPGGDEIDDDVAVSSPPFGAR